MLTRILAALDGNPASEAAARLALDLAATHKAALHGFAPVDLPWITRPMAVGIGGMSHRMTLEASELSRARRGAEYARRGIAEAAAARGIACTTATADGDPPDLVCAAAADADLIVLGHDASFGGDTPEEGPSPNLHALLARNTRPLLIVPKTHAPGPVLVAYDGSPPSMRALHMAALLGIAKGGTAAVLCADDDAAVATSRAETAARLLRAHGTEVGHLLPQHAGRDPATLITAEAQRLGAGTVVMGAYGHNGLKERLFGSCTRTLLRECPAALFVHH